MIYFVAIESSQFLYISHYIFVTYDTRRDYYLRERHYKDGYTQRHTRMCIDRNNISAIIWNVRWHNNRDASQQRPLAGGQTE